MGFGKIETSRALLRRARILVRPRYRANWIRGRYKADGFIWFVRGTNFPATHEDWLRALVDPFKGELFVDVGAHMGTWAIRATRGFERVVAFEPQPETNRILRTNVALNNLSNISVFRAALSNVDGEIKTSWKEGFRGVTRSVRVPVTTLDSFRLKPSLLKIDTEGNELAVLLGALETLRGRPRIIVETHPFSASSRNVGQYLEGLGYSVRNIKRRNRFNEIQTWLLCD